MFRRMKSISYFPSKRLIASYVFDWIAIGVIAACGAAFNAPGPWHRPFSLVDLSISYPHVEQSISTVVLVVVTLFAPAVIIFLVAFIFLPGPTVTPGTSKGLIWRRKFWEWNTGWMGLALSYALAFFFTQGMKNLFGKPRPDLLSRCQPDIANYREYVVGNFGREFSPEWVLVDSRICRQSNSNLLDDGFRSFPSGHSSSSWAGLLYLTFFFCSKFAVSIPFLANRPYSAENKQAAMEKEMNINGPLLPTNTKELTPVHDLDAIPLRNQAAAPPVFLLALPLLPISVAIYICSTRFVENYHHGFDIISGSLIGIITAWLGFRWYHLPLQQGAGWSWGARSRNRAWGIGIGRGGYVGTEGWASKKASEQAGYGGSHEMLGPGLHDSHANHTNGYPTARGAPTADIDGTGRAI